MPKHEKCLQLCDVKCVIVMFVKLELDWCTPLANVTTEHAGIFSARVKEALNAASTPRHSSLQSV